jgi:hypothetical protein
MTRKIPDTTKERQIVKRLFWNSSVFPGIEGLVIEDREERTPKLPVYFPTMPDSDYRYK